MNLNVKDEMKINFYNKESRERINKSKKKNCWECKKRFVFCINKNSQYLVVVVVECLSLYKVLFVNLDKEWDRQYWPNNHVRQHLVLLQPYHPPALLLSSLCFADPEWVLILISTTANLPFIFCSALWSVYCHCIVVGKLKCHRLVAEQWQLLNFTHHSVWSIVIVI